MSFWVFKVMNRVHQTFFLLLIVLVWGGQFASADTPPTDTDKTIIDATTIAQDPLMHYRLGVGDIITIRVFGEDDMTQEKIRISDSGIVTFPFGNMNVLNMTIHQVETAINDGLRGRFLLKPSASVNIDQYRNFYIYGEVQQPGGYPFQPGLTLRKAVSLAGGFKVRASENKMFVVREKDARQTPQKIDLNTPILPGDTVTVEESFF